MEGRCRDVLWGRKSESHNLQLGEPPWRASIASLHIISALVVLNYAGVSVPVASSLLVLSFCSPLILMYCVCAGFVQSFTKVLS